MHFHHLQCLISLLSDMQNYDDLEDSKHNVWNRNYLVEWQSRRRVLGEVYPHLSIINETCVVMVTIREGVELEEDLRKYCSPGSYKIFVTVCHCEDFRTLPCFLP